MEPIKKHPHLGVFYIGSANWIRTSNLPVTLVLMFPLSVDYIFTVANALGALVFSLYGALQLRSSHGVGVALVLALAFTVIPASFNLAFARKLRDA